MEEKEEPMTTKEILALMDWLKAHGHTPEEIIDCLVFTLSDV